MASVLAGKAMIAAGLRRPPEGWRRTVGILLRSESTRFALSAFGLRVPESGSAVPPGRDPFHYRTARALQASLATEPDAHFALEWLPTVTNRRRIEAVDLVVLEFGPDGRLADIDPYLAASGPPLPPPDVSAGVHDAIIKGYNDTSQAIEVDRPGRLLTHLRNALASVALQTHENYARRLLAASCLSFERIDPSD